MGRRARWFLQRFAARTQFAPFVWIYRWVYARAIRRCSRRLARCPGVRSLYLRRGLASGRAIYGLSDIDLLAVVDEDARAVSVVREYDRLRASIPMLGEGELEIVTAARAVDLHRHSAFYRNRFEAGRDAWRRLFGEDLFEAIPRLEAGVERDERPELIPAWRHLADTVTDDADGPNFLRRYTLGKCLGEAARVAAIVDGAPHELRREAALAALDNGRAVLDGDDDAILRTFVGLATRALAPTPASRPMRRLRVTAGDPPAALVDAVARACEAIPDARRAVLVPRLDFEPVVEVGLDPEALAGACVGAFDCLLVVDEIPSADVLRGARRAFEPLRPEVDAFLVVGEIALQLLPGSGRTVKHRDADPETFAALEDDGAFEFERTADGAFARRADGLLQLFTSGEAHRWSGHALKAVFWEAARARLIADTDADEVIDVPTSVAAITRRIVARAPHVADGLATLAGDDERAIEAHAAWAGDLLAALADGAALPEPAATKLTLAVVVVTRNRSWQLRTALESLLGQTRPPDRVVVVDNDSTDDTADVARSFEDRLPLELHTETAVGISHARNRGVAACREDIVAFFDDDCIARPDWLEELERPFVRDAKLGAVGGILTPHPGQTGLVARFYDEHMARASA